MTQVLGQTYVCDGFEHGLITTNGLYKSTLNASISSTSFGRNSGSYAARINAGYLEQYQDNNVNGVWSLYFTLAGLPSGTEFLIYSSSDTVPLGDSSVRLAGIGWNSTLGGMAAFMYLNGSVTWGSEVFVPGSNKKHLLDMRIDHLNDPTRVTWWVDGELIERAKFAASVAPVLAAATSAVLGCKHVYTPSADLWVDDWLVVGLYNGGGPEDYNFPFPTGEHRVVLVLPTGEGTHVNANHFQDNSANSPPTTPETRLDEVPATLVDTDYVKQTVAGVGDYMEYTIDPVDGDNLLAIAGGVGYKSTGIANIYMRLALNGLEYVFAQGNASNAREWQFFGAFDPIPMSDATLVALSAATIRHGYASDVSPNVEIHSVWFQVAVSDAEEPKSLTIDQLKTGSTA